MELDPEVEIAARGGDGTSFFLVSKEEDLRTATIAAFEVQGYLAHKKPPHPLGPP